MLTATLSRGEKDNGFSLMGKHPSSTCQITHLGILCRVGAWRLCWMYEWYYLELQDLGTKDNRRRRKRKRRRKIMKLLSWTKAGFGQIYRLGFETKTDLDHDFSTYNLVKLAFLPVKKGSYPWCCLGPATPWYTNPSISSFSKFLILPLC